MAYIVRAYDFFTAISKQHPDVIITKVEHISKTQSLVETQNNGTFMCESFTTKDEIFTKVYKVI